MSIEGRDREPFFLVLHDVLSGGECNEIIERAEALGLMQAPLTVAPGKYEHQAETRNNDRAMFDDRELAATLFERVRSHLPERIDFARVHSLNERFRVYRYASGQRFAPHFDGRFCRSKIEQSELTALFYLNDGCEGGETVLLEQGFKVSPKLGSAFIFEHSLLHEGRAVLSGLKYVLRTDVMYRGNRRVYAKR